MAKRPRTFSAALWYGFLRVQGPLLSGLGIIATVVLGLFANWQVPLSLATVTWTVALILIVTLGAAAYELFLSSGSVLPKALWAREIDGGTAGRTVVCLLEPSDLFSYGTLASFYYVDEFEVLIGIGRVQTIQEDGKVQVEITLPVESHRGMIQQLAGNDKTVLERLRVKPHVPHGYEAYVRRGEA